MKHNLTCIGCPMGCEIEAITDETGKFVSSSGWSCGIGKRYAQEEVTAPTRTVTALVRVSGSSRPLPVKTSRPIPKSAIPDCLAELRSICAVPPIAIGDILLKGVCGTEADIVAAKNLGIE